MNNFNKALVGILILQVILVVVLYLPESEESSPGAPLLADFQKDEVSQVQIEDSEGTNVTLTRNSNGEWVLPSADDFPANSFTVNSLLDKITGLNTSRLITRSDTSHRRLKVAEDEFNRLITLKQGDQEIKLYLGTSGGANATHVRVGDQENVYLVGSLTVTDANVQLSNWIDTLYVSTGADQVVSLTLQNANGEFQFVKVGDVWTLVGQPEGVEFNQTAFDAMLNQASQLRMSKPLGQEAKPEYGMDSPVATVSLTVRQIVVTPTPEPPAIGTAEATDETGIAFPSVATATPEITATPTPIPEPQYEDKTYTFQIGATLNEDEGVVVKSSESDFYVLISTTTAQLFTDKTQDSFVIAPTATPIPSLAPTLESTPELSSTVEVEATVEATESATAEAAVEVTAEATQEVAPEITETVEATATPAP